MNNALLNAPDNTLITRGCIALLVVVGLGTISFSQEVDRRQDYEIDPAKAPAEVDMPPTFVIDPATKPAQQDQATSETNVPPVMPSDKDDSEAAAAKQAINDTVPEWMARFLAQDADADGRLTSSEFGQPATDFEKADQDRDGNVTAKEFKNDTIARKYGLWVLLPAIVAILIAIFTRQVLVALPLGILTAAAMVLAIDGTYNPITWVTHSIDKYLFAVLAAEDDGAVDRSKLQIIVFTLFIGAMVGVIEANGGTRAMVAKVTRFMRTRERGQLGGWFAGILVFFDDYANAMIVGPSMRPVFDKLKLSREKLAYIVDSTAAPVASVFIGTWLLAEVGFIEDGLATLPETRPEFLADTSGMDAFWGSLPYRTYAWLALVMVFLIAVTGRDFGPMRKAENAPPTPPQPKPDLPANQAQGLIEATANQGHGWWRGFLPVFFLVAMTVGLLIQTGIAACKEKSIPVRFDDLERSTKRDIGVSDLEFKLDLLKQSAANILGNADSYAALIYASLSAAILAIFLSFGKIKLGKIMDAVTSGMSRMFAACIVLVLAWGLSKGTGDLQLGRVAGDYLKELNLQGTFDSAFLPLATFITAAIVSFATGTSWGTMGILCPAVVAISARLFTDMPVDEATQLFYATIGAVLTGAVFGDHCSPISDTTVLSSIAADCELGRHVWTQMPYAVIVALVGILCTDFLPGWLANWSPGFVDSCGQGLIYVCTAAGAIILFLLVLILGRKPVAREG